ncbi:MAG: acyl-CoA dehydrogenase family protein [Acidimicrobiia bacterium]|nr:acyl-CoA dehydrogenase family protein [Acidimicrobiia bacterium]
MTALAHESGSELRGTVSADDEQFRAEMRSWLAAHPPPAIQVATTSEEADVLRAWQGTLDDGGWVGIHWPVEYGGRGASLTQVAVYNEELARADAPPILGRAGVSLVGPTLMAHGTEEQRRRWMRRILSGADVWCQLFSEPDAGSDLAALSTRAEQRSGNYVVTGQKVWSSYARFADWGIALVRTDPSAAPHRGISMLAIPMTAKGIEVRPLRQMTGESEFNEVFFDEVEVPTENIIGPEHDGWRVANTTLANERGATFVWKEQVLHEVAFDLLAKACGRRGLLGDPVVRQRLAGVWIEVEIFRLHNQRTLARLTRGEELGSESSIVKLFWAGMSQRLYEVALAVLGPDALLTADDEHAIDRGRWVFGLLTSRANSIMGGTSEIQRNIIGERLLALPREPRTG